MTLGKLLQKLDVIVEMGNKNLVLAKLHNGDSTRKRSRNFRPVAIWRTLKTLAARTVQYSTQ